MGKVVTFISKSPIFHSLSDYSAWYKERAMNKNCLNSFKGGVVPYEIQIFEKNTFIHIWRGILDLIVFRKSTETHTHTHTQSFIFNQLFCYPETSLTTPTPCRKYISSFKKDQTFRATRDGSDGEWEKCGHMFRCGSAVLNEADWFWLRLSRSWKPAGWKQTSRSALTSASSRPRSYFYLWSCLLTFKGFGMGGGICFGSSRAALSHHSGILEEPSTCLLPVRMWPVRQTV